MRFGCTNPNTDSPYFGSSSSMEWPPTTNAPASRTLSAPPRSTSPTTSVPKQLGNARMFRHATGRPPMANTSDSALAAATAPNSYGSSTTGVKKSSVSTAALSSSTWYTAASSAVSNPSRMFGSGSAGAMSFSISERSPGPHFAAQPPREVSSVKRMRSLSFTMPPVAWFQWLHHSALVCGRILSDVVETVNLACEGRVSAA